MKEDGEEYDQEEEETWPGLYSIAITYTAKARMLPSYCAAAAAACVKVGRIPMLNMLGADCVSTA